MCSCMVVNIFYIRRHKVIKITGSNPSADPDCLMLLKVNFCTILISHIHINYFIILFIVPFTLCMTFDIGSRLLHLS